MLNASVRDIKIKGKKLRRKGIITGTLKKTNGEIIPISLLGCKVDQFILNNGLNKEIVINLEGEEIKTKIYRVQKNWFVHNVDNIDLIEKKDL